MASIRAQKSRAGNTYRVLWRQDGRQRSLTFENLPAAERFKTLLEDHGPDEAALGLPGAMPPGRPGDPNSDDDWFVTDWMDTTRAQEALHFRGPNCGPNCRRSTDCCATRARSSPGLCEWSWRAGRRIGTHPVSTPTRGGKHVPNWASRYGIGPKRFQRRRFHARLQSPGRTKTAYGEKGFSCECLVLSHSSIAVSLILWLARSHRGFRA